ncbi:uncharacterized protein LOC135107073 isoform X2 [Scylla paramamosain]|uniref:uncharacterized protein LOC135107073 isoform X2 n=1 Tax=Scylla paramamosain TaxID=85552 RepID=UPI0030832934
MCCQLVVHRDSEKLGTSDHLEGVRAHCELGRGHWYRGGTEMHHHSFAVVDVHPALLRPRLQSLQNCLQWRVVQVLGGNWDAHSAVIHILPAMGTCSGTRNSSILATFIVVTSATHCWKITSLCAAKERTYVAGHCVSRTYS